MAPCPPFCSTRSSRRFARALTLVVPTSQRKDGPGGLFTGTAGLFEKLTRGVARVVMTTADAEPAWARMREPSVKRSGVSISRVRIGQGVKLLRTSTSMESPEAHFRPAYLRPEPSLTEFSTSKGVDDEPDGDIAAPWAF